MSWRRKIRPNLAREAYSSPHLRVLPRPFRTSLSFRRQVYAVAYDRGSALSYDKAVINCHCESAECN